MAAGKINLQANDGKVAGIVFEDGASSNVTVTVPKEGGEFLTTEGAQTKNGVMTFSSSPIVPNATTATQAIAYGQAVKNTGDETIAGVKTFSSGIKLQNQNVSPFSGFKNYIINGNFDVWQYGTSQTLNGYRSADRWFMSINSGGNISRVSNSNGYGTFALSMNATNATNNIMASQAIESYAVNKLKTKTVTFSFYYSASVSEPNGSIAVSVQGNTTADTMLAGTWTTFAGGATTITPTTVVQRCVITVPTVDPTANGIRVNIQAVNITNGSSVYIYGCQLEEGSVATPFENRPYGLELSLCQRYYEVADSAFQGYSGVNGELWGYRQNFKVAKRVTPTLLTKSATQVNCGVSAPANGMYDSFIFSANTIAIGSFNGTLQVTASAEL